MKTTSKLIEPVKRTANTAIFPALAFHIYSETYVVVIDKDDSDMYTVIPLEGTPGWTSFIPGKTSESSLRLLDEGQRIQITIQS